MEFKESRTYANLMAAFAGEAQARVKYELYGMKARMEGYEQVGAIFGETAVNERSHANEWLQYIHGGAFPSTLPNLQDAAGGENYEWSTMYKEFAGVAREENYPQIAAAFDLVANIEKEHEARYNALIAGMQNGQIFKKPVAQKWICRNCGHVHKGTEAPGICPACKFAQAYFEIKAENY